MLTSPPPTIGVLVVDDHPVVVRGVRILLEDAAAVEVVGSASSAPEAVAKAKALQPAVVLLDFRLGEAEMPRTVMAVRNAAPNTKIVIFTANNTATAMALALDAGADGYLLKEVHDGDLAEHIRRAAAGEPVISRVLTHPRGPAVPKLTTREIQVLQHVARGRINSEIARQLTLAPNTVKTYLQSAMQKLGARNRVEAILRGRQLGII